MLGLAQAYFLMNLCIFIECVIPSLTVRKLDRNIVARKRQDTLEMCRIFTEESEKLKYNEPNELNQYTKNTRSRKKRDVGNPIYSINPALNEEDKERIEGIVDKLYDDMGEKGERVTYRHHSVPTTTVTVTLPQNITARRFNFAPAELLGPLPGREKLAHPQEETYDVSVARFPRGIVPYFIDSKTYDADLADIIMKAFDYFEKATCIRLQKLRERPTDKESLKSVAWLYITNPSGIRQCVHSNERRRTKGVQMVVFGYDCMSLGDIAHEVMHILGFSHEHTRSDRDQYVTIMWDNIKPGYKKYFDLSQGEYQNIIESLPYDYTSVLHYPPRAFSKNGQVTIHTEPGVKIGQREGLSEIDVEKIGLVYSNECVKRNKEYLLKTCPSVVRSDTQVKNISQVEIEDYFKDRLWPFGIINYQIRDKMEFSAEERENINAVIRHIEKETCLEFRDISTVKEESDADMESIKDENPANDAEPLKKTEPTNFMKLKEVVDDFKDNYNNKSSTENEIIKLKADLSDGYETETVNIQRRNSIAKKNLLKLKNKNVNEKIHNKRKIGKKTTNTKTQSKRVKRKAPLPSRRHASDILVLTKSHAPGCTCPPPGRPFGQKVLKISTDCFNSVNDLLHIFVHVLGLDHQHNMHDRDSYLHIVWKNLTPDIKEEMTKKLPPAASVGFPYDYQSVMHYPWLQIRNGVTNIMYPIWNDGWAMGHWQGLSSIDVQKLNLLYFNQCISRTQQRYNN
ncbi:hypothetical protein O3G_MSEX006198 [Manduca sexta]|uniref:Metalloendopeptidase n=1 Tax=Manduca sexta TaxID=7130 RepID=A0A921Z1T9_MANSE|nr:hypothetical protein O3G_MSEX006198 [Manduca sexta]